MYYGCYLTRVQIMLASLIYHTLYSLNPFIFCSHNHSALFSANYISVYSHGSHIYVLVPLSYFSIDTLPLLVYNPIRDPFIIYSSISFSESFRYSDFGKPTKECLLKIDADIQFISTKIAGPSLWARRGFPEEMLPMLTYFKVVFKDLTSTLVG